MTSQSPPSDIRDLIRHLTIDFDSDATESNLAQNDVPRGPALGIHGLSLFTGYITEKKAKIFLEIAMRFRYNNPVGLLLQKEFLGYR